MCSVKKYAIYLGFNNNPKLVWAAGVITIGLWHGQQVGTEAAAKPPTKIATPSFSQPQKALALRVPLV